MKKYSIKKMLVLALFLAQASTIFSMEKSDELNQLKNENNKIFSCNSNDLNKDKLLAEDEFNFDKKFDELITKLKCCPKLLVNFEENKTTGSNKKIMIKIEEAKLSLADLFIKILSLRLRIWFPFLADRYASFSSCDDRIFDGCTRYWLNQEKIILALLPKFSQGTVVLELLSLFDQETDRISPKLNYNALYDYLESRRTACTELLLPLLEEINELIGKPNGIIHELLLDYKGQDLSNNFIQVESIEVYVSIFDKVEKNLKEPFSKDIKKKLERLKKRQRFLNTKFTIFNDQNIIKFHRHIKGFLCVYYDIFNKIKKQLKAGTDYNPQCMNTLDSLHSALKYSDQIDTLSLDNLKQAKENMRIIIDAEKYNPEGTSLLSPTRLLKKGEKINFWNFTKNQQESYILNEKMFTINIRKYNSVCIWLEQFLPSVYYIFFSKELWNKTAIITEWACSFGGHSKPYRYLAFGFGQFLLSVIEKALDLQKQKNADIPKKQMEFKIKNKNEKKLEKKSSKQNKIVNKFEEKQYNEKKNKKEKPKKITEKKVEEIQLENSPTEENEYEERQQETESIQNANDRFYGSLRMFKVKSFKDGILFNSKWTSHKYNQRYGFINLVLNKKKRNKKELAGNVSNVDLNFIPVINRYRNEGKLDQDHCIALCVFKFHAKYVEKQDVNKYINEDWFIRMCEFEGLKIDELRNRHIRIIPGWLLPQWLAKKAKKESKDNSLEVCFLDSEKAATEGNFVLISKQAGSSEEVTHCMFHKWKKQ